MRTYEKVEKNILAYSTYMTRKNAFHYETYFGHHDLPCLRRNKPLPNINLKYKPQIRPYIKEKPTDEKNVIKI